MTHLQYIQASSFVYSGEFCQKFSDGSSGLPIEIAKRIIGSVVICVLPFKPFSPFNKKSGKFVPNGARKSLEVYFVSRTVKIKS
jgi:hypothetical protein